MVTINIITGIVAGIISGGMVYWYNRELNKKRDINEYANQILDHLDRVYDELIEGSEGKSIRELKKLTGKGIRRHFDGDIADGTKEGKDLQERIRTSNTIVFIDIANILEKAQEREDGVVDEKFQAKLFRMRRPLADARLNLYKSRVEYNSARKKWERAFTKNVFIVMGVLALILIWTELAFIFIKFIFNIIF